MAELDVAGIFVAPIVGYGLAALALFLVLRLVLARLGFWRAVWHPALFEAALFSAILSGLVLL
ncbi:MAG: DUF1656 domain-containing protein [Azospirillaceae bacterium]|nr:DUF1656 domain-containing protein [Azospirillaceae bacterium]